MLLLMMTSDAIIDGDIQSNQWPLHILKVLMLIVIMMMMTMMTNCY